MAQMKLGTFTVRAGNGVALRVWAAVQKIGTFNAAVQKIGTCSGLLYLDLLKRLALQLR